MCLHAPPVLGTNRAYMHWTTSAEVEKSCAEAWHSACPLLSECLIIGSCSLSLEYCKHLAWLAQVRLVLRFCPDLSVAEGI